jgi:hypothetical protein
MRGLRPGGASDLHPGGSLHLRRLVAVAAEEVVTDQHGARGELLPHHGLMRARRGSGGLRVWGLRFLTHCRWPPACWVWLE